MYIWDIIIEQFALNSWLYLNDVKDVSVLIRYGPDVVKTRIKNGVRGII